ncbi:hypothetical protein LAZ67_X000017 [Cordylochernes scorpioides]|uniref:Uncharacterized protein n=1 Tax=Cordylochernes scorpioides TaxID=51811 RepID=A0ABY6LRQ0_9ARAC|nr:hypothetical protein LAZ67_X000017 [Cordylochernes scorpioides]
MLLQFQPLKSGKINLNVVARHSAMTHVKTIKSKCSNDIVWTYSRGIRPILCGDLSPWMRHGSTTTRQKPNKSRSSGWKPVAQRQRKRSRSPLAERSWPNYYSDFLHQLDIKIRVKRPGLRNKKKSFTTGHCIYSQKCIDNRKNSEFEVRLPPILLNLHPQNSIFSHTRRNRFASNVEEYFNTIPDFHFREGMPILEKLF